MKPGDKIVCIHKTLDKVGTDLIEHKIYTVDFIHHLQSGSTEIRLAERPTVAYNIKRFATMIQYRKIKLNKIKDKINEAW